MNIFTQWNRNQHLFSQKHSREKSNGHLQLLAPQNTVNNSRPKTILYLSKLHDLKTTYETSEILIRFLWGANEWKLATHSIRKHTAVWCKY